MRCLLLLALLVTADLVAQTDARGNKKPKITGQRQLSMSEGESITLQMTDVFVEDRDDWLYPFGFTMDIYDGNDYRHQNFTITPSENFYGTLIVPVTVNDGEDNSDKYNLQIEVTGINDAPRITAQQSLSTTSGTPVQVQLSHLTVSDPDNDYPTDFTLNILSGANYSVSGSTVTPNADFIGNLPVNIRVNDGHTNSETYSFVLQVNEGNTAPIITNQNPVIINEDQNFTIQLGHLKVEDKDDQFPNGFSLSIQPGENYSLDNNTVYPSPNFSGNIFVKVTVNDGEKTSDPFNFQITIRPVNDSPTLSSGDPDSTRVSVFNSPHAIFENIQIEDIDNEQLAMAEIGFTPTTYKSATDVLSFDNTEKIKAIFDSGSGILALIGQATVQEYTEAIKSVYATFSERFTSKSIYIIVNDGQANSQRIEKHLYTSEVSYDFATPTGFTPNGDLVNDTWSFAAQESNENFAEAVVRIYTKSGVMVFESHELNTPWDGYYHGSILPADVYFYTVELVTDPLQPATSFKGIVTLLR